MVPCRKKFAVVGVLVIIFLFSYPRELIKAADPGAGVGKEIYLNIPTFRLRYYEDGKLVKEYPVAVGKPTSPTPVGEFRVISKLVNPTWYPPGGGNPVPPGPVNPLGRRWLGFAPGYGIHGTNAPGSIGKAESLGCVRMHNEDVEELFARVPLGTPVHITYETLETNWNPEQGQMRTVLYPDVYCRGTNTLEGLKQRLADMGLAGFWPETTLAALLEEREEGPVVLPLPEFAITLNGKPVSIPIHQEEGQIFLPLRPIAEQLGFAVSWDPEEDLALVGGEPVTGGKIAAGRTYLPLPLFRERLGIKANWSEGDGLLELYRITVTCGGQVITDAVYRDKGELLVAAACLEELGIPYQWDPERKLAYLLGREIPGQEREDGIYLSLVSLQEKLGSHYGLKGEWDEENYEVRVYSVQEGQLA